ncbi:MAG: hypothetical protein ACRD3J_09505 [Thermoanaerobaculia bacterium]
MNEKRPEAVFRNGMGERLSLAEQLRRHGVPRVAIGDNCMKTRILLLATKQRWHIEKPPP